MQKSARFLGGFLLAALCFVTVCPSELRPVSNEPLLLERSVPYLVLASLFSIGIPRQRLSMLIFSVAAAGLLEAGQIVQPTRRVRLPDFLVKAAGGAIGCLVTQTILGAGRARQQSAGRL